MVSGPIASVQNARALLDRKCRLAWSGPWAAWGNSRPSTAMSGVSAVSDSEAWHNSCHHTGPAVGSVKAPRWSSTLCEELLAESDADALERPPSQPSGRALSGGRRGAISSAVSSRPASRSGLTSAGSSVRTGMTSASRSWTLPESFITSKAKSKSTADGVSSVKTTLEQFKRINLQTRDFVKNRGELNMNMSKFEMEGLGDTGLYDLRLMHGQSAKGKKAYRKRPPIKDTENRPDSRNGRPDSRNGRLDSKHGKQHIKELRELYGDLEHSMMMRKRADAQQEGAASNQFNAFRRRATVSTHTMQGVISRQAALKSVEAKFREESDDNQELSKKFVELINELMEKFGTLLNALQILDQKNKGRINAQEWEKNLEEMLENKVDARSLRKVFSVLDTDSDGHITFEDVLRFDPVTTMLTKDKAFKSKEDLISHEFESEQASGQKLKKQKTALFEGLDALSQEIGKFKAGNSRTSTPSTLGGRMSAQDFTRNNRDSIRADEEESEDEFWDSLGSNEVSPGDSPSDRRTTSVPSDRRTTTANKPPIRKTVQLVLGDKGDGKRNTVAPGEGKRATTAPASGGLQESRPEAKGKLKGFARANSLFVRLSNRSSELNPKAN